MTSWFGSVPTAASKSKPVDALKQMRAASDTLGKRSEHLERKVAAEVADAKKRLAAKDKRGAMLCLKRKKAYEAQLARLDGAISTLNEQMFALESANMNVEVVAAMRVGASSMKQLHKNITVDAVDDTMQEIQDQMDDANAISEAIGTPFGDMASIDESDVDAELEQLAQDDLDDTLGRLEVSYLSPASTTTAAAADRTPSMPSVPKVDPRAAAEEEELRQLELAMAI